MKSLRIDWDTNYGIDHREGWSIHYDGSCLVALEKWFVVALFKAWREWRSILASRKANGW